MLLPYISKFFAKFLTSLMVKITLYCYIVHIGEDPILQSFPVDIDTNDSVALLKENIKKIRKNTLADIDAAELTLWGVNICCHGRGEKQPNCPRGHQKIIKSIKRKNVNIENNKKLKPRKLSSLKDVGECFGTQGIQPVKEHIQIIVKGPQEDTEESDDDDESNSDDDE